MISTPILLQTAPRHQTRDPEERAARERAVPAQCRDSPLRRFRRSRLREQLLNDEAWNTSDAALKGRLTGRVRHRERRPRVPSRHAAAASAHMNIDEDWALAARTCLLIGGVRPAWSYYNNNGASHLRERDSEAQA